MEEEKVRVVLDTNIFISSTFWQNGNPHKIIEKAIEGEINIFTSNEILYELKKILKRDFNQSDKIAEEQINLINEYAEITEIKEKLSIVKDDPDDDKILECAVSAKADFIITGDNHLLKIKEYRGIKIINPKEFLKTQIGI